jgi:hypothetical protein
MATKAKAAKGTQLQRGDGGGSEVFTTIGEVRSFQGPGRANEAVDATSFDSAAKEFIATIPDTGEVTFEVNHVGSDAQQQGLETDRVNGTLRNFKVVFNDHATTKTTFSFSALVTRIQPQGQGPGNIYTTSITLRTSGAVTISYPP